MSRVTCMDALAREHEGVNKGDELSFEAFVFESTRAPPMHTPGWPDAWLLLLAAIRAQPCRIFWEVFAGCARLSAEALAQLWAVGQPIDIIFSVSTTSRTSSS